MFTGCQNVKFSLKKNLDIQKLYLSINHPSQMDVTKNVCPILGVITSLPMMLNTEIIKNC